MKKIYRLFTIATVAVCFGTAEAAITNSLTIKEEAGITTANYPIQIARPFIQGEISNFPQAYINGQAVSTQADVKQRYWDGTVKHAIITFLIPSLQANSTITITFQNQTSGNNTGFLNKTEMMNSTYDFEALMELTNGTTITASARTMLNNNKFSYWMQGNVATSIVLADHSAARGSDIGFDSYKSFRPLFHATFFPGVNKVRVRFIGEIANTEFLEDMDYSLNLKTGNNNPTSAYTKSTFKHHGASRWTKEFWIGGAPSKISINHNLGYLKETMAFSNFDTTLVIPSATLDQYYNTDWINAAKDINERGFWTKYMPTTGGRDEISPYPAWTVNWLYTGDWRMQEIAFKMADLAGAWPMHLREGDPTKIVYDSTLAGVPPIGRPVSMVSRPTLWTWRDKWDFTWTNANDQIIPVGYMVAEEYTSDAHKWVPEGSHEGEPYYSQYMLSGDFYYLEELQFWTSWNVGGCAPGPDVFYGRGPYGHGGYADQPRGEAWIMRNRARCAYACPDGSPEKTYFTNMMHDMIAYFEGRLKITGTTYQNSVVWNWANGSVGQGYWEGKGLPPMPFWNPGSSAAGGQAPMETSYVEYGDAPWQNHYLLYALGNAKELGFKTEALLSYMAGFITGELTDPNFNPYNSISYRIATTKKGGAWIQNWSEAQQGYQSSYNAQADFNNTIIFDAHLAYSSQVLAAASMCNCYTNGPAAWDWAYTKIRIPAQAMFEKRPGWAFKPRPCNTNTAISNLNGSTRNNILVYPVPATNELSLSSSETIKKVELIDALGKSIYSSGNISSLGVFTINTSMISSGVYSVKVSTDSGIVNKSVLVAH